MISFKGNKAHLFMFWVKIWFRKKLQKPGFCLYLIFFCPNVDNGNQVFCLKPIVLSAALIWKTSPFSLLMSINSPWFCTQSNYEYRKSDAEVINTGLVHACRGYQINRVLCITRQPAISSHEWYQSFDSNLHYNGINTTTDTTRQ